jgi:hypothetical protein
MRFAGWRALALAMGVLAPSSALAVEVGDPDALLSIDIHAFVTQGFILTSNNNYLALDTKHGSFQYSEVGLNFTKDLTDRLRLGLQLFAEDIGPTGNYNATVDWFYADYRWKDWLGLRVGRVKIPFGLYNEVQDVDSARLPILLPQSVYPLENSNDLLAQTGGELYGYLRMRGAGALDYHAYLGTIFAPIPATPPTAPYLEDFNVPYVAGGRLMWELPVEGLRIGSSAQALRVDGNLLSGPATIKEEVPGILWVASVEYSAHDLLLATEYSRWFLKGILNGQQVEQVVEERAYAMAAYREAKWLQTGAYFSFYFPNALTDVPGPNLSNPIVYRSDFSRRAARQNDLAVTIRFDINAFWLVKVEGHYMFGTAGLDPALNNNLPTSDLAERWGVLLLETTAYF